MCEHGVLYQCIPCKGPGICVHDARKSECRECDGSAFCIHDLRKVYCGECGGSALCEHDIKKDRCLICTPDSKYFCSVCRVFIVRHGQLFCATCNPERSGRQKQSEMKLKTWLTDQGYTFTHNKQFYQTMYFPDFLFDCGKYMVIVENDENAHSGYDHDCERFRENNIRYAANVPCFFIRYNPDSNHEETYKQLELKAALDACLSLPCVPEIDETIFLFYPAK